MATTTQWQTPSSVATHITSAADLLDGKTLLSGAYDNTPGGVNNYIFGDFELSLPNGLGVALSVEKPVELYIITALDGTNYSDFTTDFADTAAPVGAYVGSFQVKVEAAAGTAQRLQLRGIPLPPLNFKVGIRNKTGQTLKDGVSHFTVRMIGYNVKNG